MKMRHAKKTSLVQHRRFSEAIRRQTVKDIEGGKCSVLEASRELSATPGAIYKWVHLYSRYLLKNKIMVVEEKSEAYRSKELEKRLQEVEATIGRKQMEIDFLNKLIDMANEEYKTDIKKNLGKKPLDGSKPIKGRRTGTK